MISARIKSKLKYVVFTFPFLMVYVVMGQFNALQNKYYEYQNPTIEHPLPKIGDIAINSSLTGDAFSYIGKGHGGYFGVVNEPQFNKWNVSTVAYSESDGGEIGTVRRFFDFDTKNLLLIFIIYSSDIAYFFHL